MSDAAERTTPAAELQSAERSGHESEAPLPATPELEGQGEVQASGSSSEGAMTEAEAPPTEPPVQPPPVATVVPPVRKRKLKGPPKGILKPAPPPQKAFSFRRDILQQLNSRLAQQGVNVQVPVPQNSSFGSLGGGTAQAAGSLIGGMFKRIGGFATGALDEVGGGGVGGSAMTGQRSFSSSGGPVNSSSLVDGQKLPAPQRAASYSSMASDATAASSLSTNSLPPPSSSARPIRKVRFTVSSMAVTYPISGAIAPGDEDATRIRIEREHRESMKKRREQRWTVVELEKLYRECCRTREEHPLKKMRTIFQEASQASPPALRTLDLSLVTLDRQAIEPIADLLSVEFGLNKLVLENCNLTDDGLKSILHALLVSGDLPSLSLASNKKIKYHGWRYVGIYMRRAKALRYLDLSENSINRASLEHILGAIAKSPNLSPQPAATAKDPETDKLGAEFSEEGEPLTLQAKLLRDGVDSSTSAVTSLRLENCGLKSGSLEMLSSAVRFSDLNHLSLRRNRIGQVGAVALAVMLKDYPDATSDADEVQVPSISSPVSMTSSRQNSLSDHTTDPVPGQGQGVPYTVRGAAGQQRNNDGLPRGRAGSLNPSSQRSLSPALPEVPIVISSPGGGVTSRKMPASTIEALREASSSQLLDSPSKQANGTHTVSSSAADVDRNLTHEEREEARATVKPTQTEEEAIAIYQAKRAKRILASLPKVGHLLTLDLKGNDIRGGVTYLGQALKKNRTLKVLNLSDNSIEIAGLVAIADALKYNSTLETLDMSHNPCSGPSLEGITTLRNAFTLNSNLKRLFLNDTDLSSEGAIALAEFLPEAKSLIHLDLTENIEIDIAGVMALAVSVKMNKSLRCLDLNIPPNAPDFARLSQDILNSCIRNTENAQRKATQRGVKAPVAAPIYKSTLARAAKEKDDRARAIAAARAAEEQARVDSERQDAKGLIDAATECKNVLVELLAGEEERRKAEVAEDRTKALKAAPTPSDFVEDLLAQSGNLRARLQKSLAKMEEGKLLEEALQLNDELESVTRKFAEFYRGPAPPELQLEGRQAPEDDVAQKAAPLGLGGGVEASGQDDRLRTPSSHVIESEMSSPTFSIGSDDEDDEDGDGLEKGGSKSKRASLRLDTQQMAPREDPLLEEEEAQAKTKDTLSSPVDKARGQLSEEGEIFRRAKSLNIDGEQDDEDDEDGEQAASAHSTMEGAGEGANSDVDGPKLDGSASPKSESSELSSSNGSAKARPRTGSFGGDEVSGEELRKELLETDVPRNAPRVTSSSSPPDTDEAQPVA